MKLIEMLIDAFDIIGRWPEKIDAISQEQNGIIRGYINVNGHLYRYPGYMLQMCHGLAEDYDTAFVTREQYEAALAAAQPQWDGEGLPPVGCVCEFRVKGKSRWESGIVGIVRYTSPFTVVISGDKCERVHLPIDLEFRPIRSEADKKRDAAVVELSSVIDYRNGCSSKPLAGWLYDAIAAGKIPGVKLSA